MLTTGLALAALEWAALSAAPLPVRLAASVVLGLVVGRGFVLYHDFLHGSLLRRSVVGRVVFHTFGILVMTPPRIWRETHNYHHAHTAKLVGSHIGSYPMATTTMWRAMTPRMRLRYRFARHPVTMMGGAFTMFAYGMCIAPLRKNPRKNWEAGVALLVALAMSAFLVVEVGGLGWLLAYALPLAVALGLGAYLFYAQHNFEGVHVQPREDWTYVRAALESSSYMPMGRVMRWFLANIGYHHVHHLNPSIPFYRLPEAMAAIAECQTPRRTSLAPRDVFANCRLKLWDPDLGKMTGYPVD